MKKWLCLILTLCLLIPAATLAEETRSNWLSIFMQEETAGENDLQLTEEQGSLTLTPIAPFIDLSWEEVTAYGDDAHSHITRNQVTASGLEFTVHSTRSEGGAMLSGTISVEDDDYFLLKAVWQELGQECREMYDSCRTVEGVDGDSKAAYAFSNDETYLRFEFIDAGSYRFIIFVALAN